MTGPTTCPPASPSPSRAGVRAPRRGVGLWLMVLIGLLVVNVPSASADLVFLTTGRSLSVRRVAFDGEQAILTLRNGGEIVCARSAVARVAPDEVPYPEPVAADSPAADPAEALPRVDVKPVRVPGEYRALVTSLAGRHGVDAGLVHAVITVESAYQPRARSRKGAKGLMQLMPATARQYGVSNAYHVPANVEAGVKHLKSLLDRFELSLALAAYNAGEATVRRFNGIPPYKETREYVAKVLALAAAFTTSEASVRNALPSSAR